MARCDQSVGDICATVFALGSRLVRTADGTGCPCFRLRRRAYWEVFEALHGSPGPGTSPYPR